MWPKLISRTSSKGSCHKSRIRVSDGPRMVWRKRDLVAKAERPAIPSDDHAGNIPSTSPWSSHRGHFFIPHTFGYPLQTSIPARRNGFWITSWGFVSQELKAAELNIPKVLQGFSPAFIFITEETVKWILFLLIWNFIKKTDRSNADLVFRDVSSLLKDGKTRLLFTPLLQGEGKKKIVFHKLRLFEDAGKPFCTFRDLLQRGKKSIYPPHVFIYLFFSWARIPARVLFLWKHAQCLLSNCAASQTTDDVEHEEKFYQRRSYTSLNTWRSEKYQ